jgi:hypothetical protein
MEHGPSSEGKSCSAVQARPRLLWDPKVHLPFSQESVTSHSFAVPTGRLQLHGPTDFILEKKCYCNWSCWRVILEMTMRGKDMQLILWMTSVLTLTTSLSETNINANNRVLYSSERLSPKLFNEF